MGDTAVFDVSLSLSLCRMGLPGWWDENRSLELHVFRSFLYPGLGEGHPVL